MASYKIVFVCLGNICRSPLAEVIFKKLVGEKGKEKGFLIESRGIGGWYAGEGAHPETLRNAKKHRLDLTKHRSKQLTKKDLKEFDIIVAMDRSNLRDIKRMNPKGSKKIFLIRDYDDKRDSPDVPDPFYEGGFEEVYQILRRSCSNLLETLL